MSSDLFGVFIAKFFDPKKYSLASYPEAQSIIERIKSASEQIIEHKEAVQYTIDPINCGVYVLSYLEQRVINELPFSENVQAPEKGIIACRLGLAEQMTRHMTLPS